MGGYSGWLCCKTSVLESHSPQYFHAITNMSQSSTADMIEKTYSNPPVEIQEMLDIPPVNSLNYSDWFQNLWFFHVNWVLLEGSKQLGWDGSFLVHHVFFCGFLSLNLMQG